VIEEIVLGEPPHLQDPIENGSIAVEGQMAVGAAGDRANSQIKRRSRSPIERKLGSAKFLAQGNG
jgi:hypothetical protein